MPVHNLSHISTRHTHTHTNIIANRTEQEYITKILCPKIVLRSASKTRIKTFKKRK